MLWIKAIGRTLAVKFSCGICNKTFDTAGALIAHGQKVHQQRWY